jgi:hypothetical protein
VFLVASLGYLLFAGKGSMGGSWFLLFMLAHGSLICLLFTGLQEWLTVHA